MTSQSVDLSGVPVLLSASIPDEIANTPDAQRVYDYVTAVVRSLLGAGATLVFGGHPTITPLVHRAAKALGERKPPISLYQLERFRGQEPPETKDTTIFDDVHWVGDRNLDINADLVNLRDPMIAQAKAAVFVGGKTTGLRAGNPASAMSTSASVRATPATPSTSSATSTARPRNLSPRPRRERI
jgi:hypothetical protein